MLYSIEAKKVVELVSYDGSSFHSEKRQGLVGDHFTNLETIKNFKAAIGHNRYSTTGETSLRNIQPFFADLYHGGSEYCS